MKKVEDQVYSEEELMLMGVDELDFMAFGYISGQLCELEPEQISIIYPCDLENPAERYRLGGLNFLRSIDLTKPVDIQIDDQGKLCLEDGHNRYFAASHLGKKLNATIRIKGNPVRFILNRQRREKQLESSLEP